MLNIRVFFIRERIELIFSMVKVIGVKFLVFFIFFSFDSDDIVLNDRKMIAEKMAKITVKK